MVSELDAEYCASEDVGPQGRWIVRSHLGWRGEQNIPYKGYVNLSLSDAFWNCEVDNYTDQKTISISGEIGLAIYIAKNITKMIFNMKFL